MVDKSIQLVESVAQGLSRRGFLGRLARGAGITAAALGGVLAAAGSTHAKGPKRQCYLDSDCGKGQICIYPEDAGWGDPGYCWSPPKGKGNNK